MNKHKGFTIVELTVIIAVLGILATVTALGLGKYQTDARDSQRVARVTVISDYLERYYKLNGEYPSCAAITGTADAVQTNVLKGIDKGVLVAPRAPATATNSIRCGVTLQPTAGEDFFQYVGNSATQCTGSSFCTTYTLRYREESTKTVKELAARRS